MLLVTIPMAIAVAMLALLLVGKKSKLREVKVR